MNSGIVNYLVKGCDGAVAFFTPMVVFIYYFIGVEVSFKVANDVFFNDLFNCAKVVKGPEGTYIVDWFAFLVLWCDAVNFEYLGEFPAYYYLGGEVGDEGGHYIDSFLKHFHRYMVMAY